MTCTNVFYGQVCMVFNGGELTIVDSGTCRVLGSCRTEHAAGALTSLRLNDAQQGRCMQGPAVANTHPLRLET